MSELILLDSADRVIGAGDKIRVHQQGMKHKAFSVIILDDQQRMLLHKRAEGKYHSGGLWTNACCGHPRPKFNVVDEAKRRLRQEMGFSCELRFFQQIEYRGELDNGMIEHESVDIFTGYYQGQIRPDPLEASDYSYFSYADIKSAITHNPDNFSYWFKCYFDAYGEQLFRLS